LPQNGLKHRIEGLQIRIGRRIPSGDETDRTAQIAALRDLDLHQSSLPGVRRAQSAIQRATVLRGNLCLGGFKWQPEALIQR